MCLALSAWTYQYTELCRHGHINVFSSVAMDISMYLALSPWTYQCI